MSTFFFVFSHSTSIHLFSGLLDFFKVKLFALEGVSPTIKHDVLFSGLNPRAVPILLFSTQTTKRGIPSFFPKSGGSLLSWFFQDWKHFHKFPHPPFIFIFYFLMEFVETRFFIGLNYMIEPFDGNTPHRPCISLYSFETLNTSSREVFPEHR